VLKERWCWGKKVTITVY